MSKMTEEQRKRIPALIGAKSEHDTATFIDQCERTGLDPFARQIYGIYRSGKLSIQASIDGMRLVAERSGKYEGQTDTLWCNAKGEWRDVWLAKENPAAAKVGVWKAGAREATTAVARWASYAQGSTTWQKMPLVFMPIQ